MLLEMDISCFYQRLPFAMDLRKYLCLHGKIHKSILQPPHPSYCWADMLEGSYSVPVSCCNLKIWLFSIFLQCLQKLCPQTQCTGWCTDLDKTVCGIHHDWKRQPRSICVWNSVLYCMKQMQLAWKAVKRKEKKNQTIDWSHIVKELRI